MKFKLIIVFFSVIFSITACNEKSPSSNYSTSPSAHAPEDEPKITGPIHDIDVSPAGGTGFSTNAPAVPGAIENQ